MTGATTAAWEEPRWMSDARIASDAYAQQVTSCMAEKGWDVIVSANGGMQPRVYSDSLGAGYDAAADSCLDSIPLPEYRNVSGHLEYERQLDVRRCLEAQGYDMPPQPPEDVWNEEDGVSGYPFEDLYQMLVAGKVSITPQEWQDLTNTCLQSAGSVNIAWG